MDDLKKIVRLLENLNEKIEKIDKKLEGDKTKSLPKKEKQLEKKPTTLTGLIIQFKKDGFFDKPKTLKEITQKLQEQGWHYPKTSLSRPLQRLLRKREIGRVAIKGKWAYVRR